MLTDAVSGVRDKARLAGFFTKLTVKEHLAPNLHVRPLVAELFLTDNCNLKCVSCACWRTTTRSELDTDEWKSVISQLADTGIIKANFTGGEPLLRRDAPELMAHAYAAGIRNLHLNSNAVLLDERRRAAVVDAGVRSFNISVDGPDVSTHELIRGVAGSFDKTIDNLRALLAMRHDVPLRVRMNFTVMRSNLRALPDMIRLAQSLGVRLYLNLATDTTFLFRDEQVTAEAHNDRADLRDVLAEVEALLRQDRRLVPRYSEWRYLSGHFSERLQRELPCAESQLKLMVHSRGEVGGCWGHDPKESARALPIASIVDSAYYRVEHARFYRKDCVGCGSNYALNLRWRPSSYAHDVMWRLGRRSVVPAR
ncbi:MAG: radical SAM protein [Actinomycetes bacterium]